MFAKGHRSMLQTAKKNMGAEFAGRLKEVWGYRCRGRAPVDLGALGAFGLLVRGWQLGAVLGLFQGAGATY